MSAALSNLVSRLLGAVILVLIALGGAGLAVAADQPHTDESRPELTARADTAFLGWRAEMAGHLVSANDDLDVLSQTGRDILANLRAQDVDALEASLDEGEMRTADVHQARADLLAVRLAQATELPDRRLGDGNRAILAGVDDAIEALGGVPGAWDRMSVAAEVVAELLGALADHDELVFEATDAGRGGRWAEAVGRLDEAEAALARAGAVRDRLANAADVATLDELLRRYSTYDEALRALYSELAAGAAPDSSAVAAFERAVEAAQQGLPQDHSAITVVVADALGPAVADSLIAIETARGRVAAVRASITEAEEAGR